MFSSLSDYVVIIADVGKTAAAISIRIATEYQTPIGRLLPNNTHIVPSYPDIQWCFALIYVTRLNKKRKRLGTEFAASQEDCNTYFPNSKAKATSVRSASCWIIDGFLVHKTAQ